MSTWPRVRLTTYGDGTAVRSGDLDELQDAVIGAKHGLVTLWTPTITAAQLLNITAPAGYLQANADAAFINNCDIGSFLEGTTIAGGHVRLFGTAVAQDIQVNVQLNKADGTQALLLAATVHNPAAAWAIFDLALDLAYPNGHVLLAGETITGSVSMPKAGARIGAFGIDKARD